MKTRIVGLLALVLLVGAAWASTASAGNGNGNGNTKAPPGWAQAAADPSNWVVTTTNGPVTQVTQQQAIAAGQQPGAVTNGAVTASSTSCWQSTVQRSWSLWPAQMVLYDNAYWCGTYNGSITYRSHSDYQGGSYCDPQGTWEQTVYWYSGSPLWKVQDGGNWFCFGVTAAQHSMTVDMSSSGAHWIE